MDRAGSLTPRVLVAGGGIAGPALALFLRDFSYEAAFETFERHRKPRAEKVVAEGRRRGRDKAIVGPLQQQIRELMIRMVVPLFGRHGDRWLYDYEVPW